MSGSAIYNHRTLQPTGSAHGHTRLGDALETIKQEYDLAATELVQARTLRDEYEGKVTSQINELNIIRQSLYELEAQHGKVRHQYEEEIAHLRAELHALRHPQALPGPGIHGSSFGESGPGYFRGGERERVRGRELERDRDTDRERGERDPKRLKMKAGGAEHFSPLVKTLPPVQGAGGPPGHNGGPLPSIGVVNSPHASARGIDGPLRGPATDIRAPGEVAVARGLVVPGDSPHPHARAPIEAPHPHPHAPASPDDWLDSTDPTGIPADLKKEGSDWFAVFSPRVRPRALTDVGLVHTLMHATVVCCVQFSADGKFLATGCNRTAQIYDVKTGVKTCVLVDDGAGNSGDLYIRSVRFSPDGRYLATGAEDKQIRIWDIAKKRIRNVFEGHQQEIYSLDFSRDGRRLVSGSGDRTARVWDMDTGVCTVLAVGEAADSAGDAGVTSVAMSPDGRYVAAGSLDTVVRIWDAQTGVLVERLRGHRDSVYSVVFTPDGRGIVSGSLDKTLKYWDVSGLGTSKVAKKEGGGNGNGKDTAVEKVGQCTMNFAGHKDYVLSVAVSHDGQWVVSGSKDRGVQFWDRAGVVQCKLQGHKNSVISIDLNPTNPLLATGSGDNLARIWSYSTV
ncbi:chromatin associated protein [Mycena maculata]|uniref:Chromatin associated protein n=1 Tax=Mycena maculata TaxID=230809 RepID=A0AAD7MPY1_9AGAR|nr:chromatin associated protein [Mycena maculata]